VRRQPREKQNGAPPKRARGNDDVILQAAGISSFRRECAAVPGQIASQHFSYYASARVFIFAAVKGAGMRFSVYLRWHNNPVGIGMQDNFAAGGKRGQLHTGLMTIEQQPQALEKKQPPKIFYCFTHGFWCKCCRSVGNFSF
jgi:hypothetical protein